jgi:DNA repair protein NreA
MEKKCDHNKNKIENCPICIKRNVIFNFKNKQLKNKMVKESFFSSSPAPFIGRFNYPNINVGILGPQKTGENNYIFDSPKFWTKNNLSINSIANLRSELINARTKLNVKKYFEISKEIGMASKPVDVEINLQKTPFYSTKFDLYNAPLGPTAELKNAKTTSNPKIHQKVDKVSNEIYLKASESLNYLYKNNFDENFLTKLFSVGSVGLKKDRKLVPTRWSITAVDDTLGKNLIQEIKNFKTKNYETYFGSHLGNYYLFLLIPEVWSYELFEIAVEKDKKINFTYSTDFENYNGRKEYAKETAGGYYSVRLALLEHLKKEKKQATVLIFRFITDEYTMPLGVWVTREASRNALNSKNISFHSKELMIKYAEMLAKRKFGVEISHLIKKSKVMHNLKQQKLL